MLFHEPVGVVGAITPWNYPIYHIAGKVAPALHPGAASFSSQASWHRSTRSSLARFSARPGPLWDW